MTKIPKSRTSMLRNVGYSDNSSVLLNTLEDFHKYHEVRPLVSEAVHLSWTYLIRFQDKKYPEKQIIELSFAASDRSVTEDLDFPFVVRRIAELETSVIRLRISHTARSWGTDIESLLSGHIKSLIKEESRINKYIYKKSGEIGVASAGLFWASLVGLATYWVSQLASRNMDMARKVLSIGGDSQKILTARLEFIVTALSNGSLTRGVMVISGAFFMGLIFSIPFGVLVTDSAENRPKSYVLLTKGAEEAKKKSIKKRQRKWLQFILALVGSVTASVIANYIFRSLTQ